MNKVTQSEHASPDHLQQALRQKAQTIRRRLALNVLAFLAIRADADDRREIIQSGALDSRLFTDSEQELLKLWLDLYAENPAVTYSDLQSRIALRRLPIDAGILTAAEACSAATAENCLDALKQLAQTCTTLNFLQAQQEQLERLDAGLPLELNFLQRYEKIFSLQDKAQPYTAESVEAQIAQIYTEAKFPEKFALPTGYPDFDREFGGLRRGGLNLICGRPGEGKTMIAINVLDQILTQNPQMNAVFISLEMQQQEILRRLFVSHDNPVFNENSLSTLTFENLGKFDDLSTGIKIHAVHRLKRLIERRLIIYDKDPMTIAEIEELIFTLNFSFKPDVIFIDYWQLIIGGRGQNLREKLVDVSNRLKTLAKRSNLVFVVLAQLRRQPAAGDEVLHPTLQDIAESDQIGRDAALAMTISSMKAADESGSPYTFRGFEVIKNRNGKKGLLRLFFNGDAGRFYDGGVMEDWPKQYREKRQKLQGGGTNMTYSGRTWSSF